MTPEEKFLFDLEGYVILKQVLTADEIAALKAILDQKCSAAIDRSNCGRVFGASN
jgi:hypothetical protein